MVISPRGASRRRRAAFTLVDLLAALAVLGILVFVLLKVFNNVSNLVIHGSNQVEKNQVVRAVLQQIGRDVDRTVNLACPSQVNCITCLYSTGPTPAYYAGCGISTQTLYCLSALTSYEGLTNGNSFVNIGYQIATVGATNRTYTGLKWVLQRGDDAGVVVGNPYQANWFTHLSDPSVYWKTMADNVVGLAFQFYTNGDLWTPTWPLQAGQPGYPQLVVPLSIGVSVWVIDSVNYNLALALDPTLSVAGGPAAAIFTNNVHQYNVRFFLPSSTQNNPPF